MASRKRSLIMKNIIFTDAPVPTDENIMKLSPLRQMQMDAVPTTTTTSIQPKPPPRRRSQVSANPVRTMTTTPVSTEHNKPKCARCLTQLGRFFNTGSPCPFCGQRICSSCRIRIYLPKKTWLCTLCVQERQLHMASGDGTLKRNEVLMRPPVPINAEVESRTLPRRSKKSVAAQPPPLSSSSSFRFGGTIPYYDDPMELTTSIYGNATHGRPVLTSGGTPRGVRKKLLKKTEKLQQLAVISNGTLPRSNHSAVITPDNTLRRQKAETITFSHIDKSLAKPALYVKEKFEQVSVSTRTTQVTFSPKMARKEGFEMHPRLLNGVSYGNGVGHIYHQYVKSATLDRVYLRRQISFSKDIPSKTSPTSGKNSNSVFGTPYQPDVVDCSAATLPRANKKVKRDESLLSAYSYVRSSGNPSQSLSLLNLAHKSGLALTEPQLTLKKLATNRENGIRHPSYIDRTVFNRVDNRRRSFMLNRSSPTRSSTRTTSSDDPFMDKFISTAISLDYDHFLAVVKSNLQETAIYYTSYQPIFSPTNQKRVDPWEQLHVSIIEIKPPVSIPAPDDQGKCGESDEMKKFFHVSESIPVAQVQIVLQESPEHEDRPPSKRLSRNNSMRRSSGRKFMYVPTEIENSKHKEQNIVEKLPALSNVIEVTVDGLKSDSSADYGTVTSVMEKPSVIIENLDFCPKEDKPIPVRNPVTVDAGLEFNESQQVKNDDIMINLVPEITADSVGTYTDDQFACLGISNHQATVKRVTLSESRVAPSVPVVTEQQPLSNFLHGFPKLREVPKAILIKKPPQEDVPEFQRVRERLREAKKDEDQIREKTSPTQEEDVDQIRKVSSAIQHFKKVNREVQDLKEFLRVARTQPQAASENIELVMSPHEESSNSLPSNGAPLIRTPEEHMLAESLHWVESAGLDNLDRMLELELPDPVESWDSIDSKTPDQTSWHALQSRNSGSEVEELNDDLERESNSSAFSDDGIPSVRACRKITIAEFDDDTEMDSSDLCEEKIETWDMESVMQMQQQTVDLFGRLQVPLYTIDEESEDDEDRETLFTRTTNRRIMRSVVSLDTSPDEDDERGIEDEDFSSWQEDDQGSNLEQYFITGLLQPAGAKRPYFRADLDFDTLENDDENPVPAGLMTTTDKKEDEQPSIFKSARLQFVSSSDYRLSSDNDMDDLSASNPSDDESLYY